MRPGAAVLAIVLGLAAPAFSEAPAASLRPEPRPGPGTAPALPSDRVVTPSGPVVVTVRATRLAPVASLRPWHRPGLGRRVWQSRDSEEPLSPELPPQGELAGGTPWRTPPGAPTVTVSPRPPFRPAGLEREVRVVATRGTPASVTQPGLRGALCGQPGIIGERLEPIRGRTGGCGISEPVRVREIDGIPLTQPATLNCDAAVALRDWLHGSVVPAVGRRGGGVASLRVIASYSCRTRNSQPGARLSEHATGNAVDVAAIGLVNGSEISVLRDWGNGREGRILRDLHRGACGRFGTVLGPNSDRHHRDHFHLDVASYRRGAYCR